MTPIRRPAPRRGAKSDEREAPGPNEARLVAVKKRAPTKTRVPIKKRAPIKPRALGAHERVPLAPPTARCISGHDCEVYPTLLLDIEGGASADVFEKHLFQEHDWNDCLAMRWTCCQPNCLKLIIQHGREDLFRLLCMKFGHNLREQVTKTAPPDWSLILDSYTE